MALVRYSVLYNGPFAVYTSRTGLTDIRTGLAELGGGFNVGDFMDLTESEANSWSAQYLGQGANLLHAGRYRIVQVSTLSTASTCKAGYPCGIANWMTVQQAIITAAGSGQTAGTYNIASSDSGGTSTSNLQVVVGSAGTIISATATTPGAGFTSLPTWTLTTLGGTPGTVVAQMTINPYVVGSFDTTASTSLYSPRGVFLNPTALTAAQVAAGAYVLIQEEGVATIYVTTATNTALPLSVNAATAGAVTTTTATTTFAPAGFLGYSLDVAAAASTIRVPLQLPLWQG